MLYPKPLKEFENSIVFMNFLNNMWFFTFFTHMTLKLDLFKNRFQIPIWQLLADLPCKFESEIPFLTTFFLQKDNFGKKKEGNFSQRLFRVLSSGDLSSRPRNFFSYYLLCHFTKPPLFSFSFSNSHTTFIYVYVGKIVVPKFQC